MSGINVYTLDDLRAIVRENDPRIMITGEVFLDHRRDGNYLCFEEYQGKNIVPTEGLNYILDVVCGAESKPAAWYCGIFTGNYTPIATNTAATALGAAGLFTEAQDATYTPATNRPAYTVVAAAAGVLTNTASKAEFTIAASSTTIYGAFLASSQAKTATTGKLLAAKKFDTARAVVATDVLYVTYQITVTSS